MNVSDVGTEYLCEMRECSLDIVLVIEAEAAHVNGIGIQVVQLQHCICPLRSLAQDDSASLLAPKGAHITRIFDLCSRIFDLCSRILDLCIQSNPIQLITLFKSVYMESDG